MRQSPPGVTSTDNEDPPRLVPSDPAHRAVELLATDLTVDEAWLDRAEWGIYDKIVAKNGGG